MENRKRTNHFTLPLLVIIFLTLISLGGIGQDVIGVRYKVISNMLMDIAHKYPSKKESIEKKIHDETPEYIDFILIDHDLVQCFWSYNHQLLNIKIYSNKENQIVYIDNENEVMFESKPSEFDSVSVNQKNESDSTYTYQITEKGAFPITITLNNPISNMDFKYRYNFGQYPEITVITELLIFPVKYVMGSPKAMMTFDLVTNLEPNDLISKEEYLHFLKNIKSKNERLQFSQRFTHKKPVDPK